MRFCYSLLPICYFNMLNTLQMCLYTTCIQFPWKPKEGVWVSGTHMALSSHVGVENWILASWERQRAHAWRTWLEHGRGPNTDDQGHFRKVEASRQWQRLVNQDEELPLPPLDQGCTTNLILPRTWMLSCYLLGLSCCASEMEIP